MFYLFYLLIIGDYVESWWLKVGGLQILGLSSILYFPGSNIPT